MNKTVSNFLLGFLAGAAAGALAGILLAPDKGSATRQNIRKKVKELSDDFGLGISDLIDEMGLEAEPAVQKKRTKSNAEEKPKRKYVRKQANL
jgi:gas vesicle protein